MSPAAVILAAGASRRMGFPKPLLEIDGRTFLDRLILAFAPHADPIVVVLGHHADRIRAAVPSLDRARVVVNPDPERGQLSSLQCGLAQLPPGCPGTLFTPVDYPRLLPSTVAALVRAFANRLAGIEVVVPVCRRRRGHPVCVSARLVAELLALPGDARARDVIRAHRDATLTVDVDDPGILHDVDDPAAYRDAVRSQPARPAK